MGSGDLGWLYFEHFILYPNNPYKSSKMPK